MSGLPAGFTRRPQMSELTRSPSCQSGPCSSTTTFLPCRAMTAAKTDPEAPAPTMATSTFSRVVMSPPRRRRDVGHVGNAEGGVALHGPIDHVDRVAARHQVDERSGRPLPAVDLVLAHAVDEIVLPAGVKLGKALTVVVRLARPLDGRDRRPVEVRIGRTDVEDAC